MLTGIAHVNLTVPAGTLDQAEAFYGETLGMHRVPVPALQRESLAWFVDNTKSDLPSSGRNVDKKIYETNTSTKVRHHAPRPASAHSLRARQRQQAPAPPLLPARVARSAARVPAAGVGAFRAQRCGGTDDGG